MCSRLAFILTLHLEESCSLLFAVVLKPAACSMQRILYHSSKRHPDRMHLPTHPRDALQPADCRLQTSIGMSTSNSQEVLLHPPGVGSKDRSRNTTASDICMSHNMPGPSTQRNLAFSSLFTQIIGTACPSGPHPSVALQPRTSFLLAFSITRASHGDAPPNKGCDF